MAYKRKDYYHQRAKQLAYRSRAAFKLIELDRKLGLLKQHDYVVDLGAWPGSWLQVIAEAVGPKGKVVGVDLAELEALGRNNIILVQADATDPSLPDTILRLLGRQADLLLSDMAPKLSGVAPTDAARVDALANLSLSIARKVLKPEGKYLCKLFGGSEAKEFARHASRWFRATRLCRPPATRSSSSEVYLFGNGFKGSAIGERGAK